MGGSVDHGGIALRDPGSLSAHRIRPVAIPTGSGWRMEVGGGVWGGGREGGGIAAAEARTAARLRGWPMGQPTQGLLGAWVTDRSLMGQSLPGWPLLGHQRTMCFPHDGADALHSLWNGHGSPRPEGGEGSRGARQFIHFLCQFLWIGVLTLIGQPSGQVPTCHAHALETYPAG